MRRFDYPTEYGRLLTPEIVALLTEIHEHRGEQARLAGQKEASLSQLVEIARIQSTDASNRIEGIVTTDERLNKLVREKTMPKTGSEMEIAGYRDVLNTIHINHDYIPLRPSVILQLHRDLYQYSPGVGGSFKNSDNVITERLPDGTKRVRFEPVPAWETPEAVECLCAAYDEALQNPALDPLLLTAMFVLDFLCIHPFNDGNGRMSRLLTLLLLCRAGYPVGRYVSLEKRINDTKESYYDALQASSVGWHEERNDYAPFARYLLGVIASACRELETRVRLLTAEGVSKPDRIRAMIREHSGKITKSEILAQCPDVSQVTVQRALKDLLDSGDILKISGGRYTAYIWNREKE